MYGTSVTDPYRYFENRDDPAVQKFFRDQNAGHASGPRPALSGAREQLFHRIAQLDNAGASVGSVSRVGPYYFYEKLNPGENSLRLDVRRVDGGDERILVNPEALAKAGQHYTINYYLPSLDGSRVAYGISEGGSEAEVIHVVDTATGQILPDAIDRAYYIGATSWLPGNNEFYYVRFPKMRPGEPLTDKETRAVAYLHVLGRDPDKDIAVFGYGVNPKVPFGLTRFSDHQLLAASPRTLSPAFPNGVKNERTIYATRADRLDAPDAAWAEVASESDDVVGYDLRGSTIYLLTHKEAPTYKIVSTSLDAPDVAGARTVVPASKNVIVDSRDGERRTLRSLTQRRFRSHHARRHRGRRRDRDDNGGRAPVPGFRQRDRHGSDGKRASRSA